MKIGIYGGTFNPIHNGHTYLLKYLLKNKICDKLIVLVSGNPPHKNDGVLDESHRFNMVKLALSDCSDILVSDMEMGKSERCYTFNTMRLLREQYKNDELWFIVGADSFKDLPKWYRGEELIKENKFIAVNREGAFQNELYKEKCDEIKEKYGATVEFVDIKTPDISSTAVRKMVEEGKIVSSYVPDSVYKYITDNKLYGWKY